MIRTWATVLICDRCRAESAPDVTDGWLKGQRMILPDGLVWNELCPDCQNLSYREMVTLDLPVI